MAGADMDDGLVNLLAYAASLGIALDGIAPRRLPGRGCGIVATRAIRPGDTVLAIPTRALRTLATVPRSMARRLDRDVSVHGILAADLALSTVPEYRPWDAVLPTRADLEGMPARWPPALQALLPSPAKDALDRQLAKLNRDWAGVRAWDSARDIDANDRADPAGLTYDAYMHAWLLVNSRTFYYTTPRSEKTTASHDDRMAMQPVADLFNHAADHGCKAAYSPAGFAFTADRAYDAGDEVSICYGAHSNDALLVEYGFLLGARRNRWDEVCLDAVVLPRLSAAARDDLAAVDFLGRYMVDAQTPGGCYRTQVALRRVLCGTSAAKVKAWRAFVEGVPDASGGRLEATQEQLDALLLELLAELAECAQTTLAAVDAMGGSAENGKGDEAVVGTPGQRAVLAERWHQIESMAVEAAREVRGGDEVVGDGEGEDVEGEDEEDEEDEDQSEDEDDKESEERDDDEDEESDDDEPKQEPDCTQPAPKRAKK